MTHTWLRKAISSTFVGFCALSVLVALVPLAFMLFFVVSQGIQALNIDSSPTCRSRSARRAAAWRMRSSAR